MSGKTRILIVEDSPTQSAALERLLSRAGYAVAVAPDAQAALAQLAREAADLVVSDVVMPGLSGYQMCRAIKEDAGLKETPVVLLTALTDPGEIITALKSGADSFITKPYQDEFVLAQISQILDTQKLRRKGFVELGLDFYFSGEKHHVRSNQMQIVYLLLSTFENAVQKNRELGAAHAELLSARDGLKRANAELEERVRERTARIAHLNTVLLALRNVNQLITRERDARKLVEKACEILIKDRGYFSALIILIDAEGRPHLHAHSGESPDRFAVLAEGLGKGVLPPCCEKARAQEEVFHAAGPAACCAACPMSAQHGGRAVLSVRMRHEGRTAGYLSVTVDHDPEIIAEEQSLVAELAGDVAFALRTIEQEAAMRRSEERRRAVEAQLLQSQKLEVVGRLAGGVAHDFNNLLTAILGNCGFLLNDIPKNDPRYADVTEIQTSGKRAADLTRQLLAFSRKQVLLPKVLDLNAVLTDMERLLRRLIGEDVGLTVSCAKGLPPVKADPGQLEQVVMNLAVNARDAMPHGGRLTIETRDLELRGEEPRSQDFTMPPGRYVLLTVSDTGVGMDAETLGHLFEPFFTTKALGKGTGLGLATVYGIVKQSGGFIDVESGPGRGATFKIFLPAAAAALPNEGAAEARKPHAGDRRGTILLVEDDEIVRRMACRILKSAGHAVLEAGSAREALAQAGEGFDLVLTDIVLTDMSGVKLAAQLKKEKPGVSVIHMSGYTDNQEIRDILSRPESRFLQKPFTAKGLLDKVREALG